MPFSLMPSKIQSIYNCIHQFNKTVNELCHLFLAIFVYSGVHICLVLLQILLLLRSSIGRRSIKDDTCVWDRLFNFPTIRAATFHLQGFINLMHAVFLCDHTIGCEAYSFSFTTDGYGIFNTRTNLGTCCAPQRGGQAQRSLHKS